MINYVDPDFQRRLDEWNDAKGGPTCIALAWHPQKDRWQVFAVPVSDSYHPLARNKHTAKMLTNFPDGSGRRGILLNTWQGAQGEFLPLDERLFEAINWADSFRDRQHFENTIEAHETKRELAQQKHLRDLAAYGREYWWRLNSVMKNMNPEVNVGGDWRAKQPWH